MLTKHPKFPIKTKNFTEQRTDFLRRSVKSLNKALHKPCFKFIFFKNLHPIWSKNPYLGWKKSFLTINSIPFCGTTSWFFTPNRKIASPGVKSLYLSGFLFPKPTHYSFYFSPLFHKIGPRGWKIGPKSASRRFSAQAQTAPPKEPLPPSNTKTAPK